ncbi:MAG TPA: hypothetical protein K8V15_10670 [Tessaracoccus flavescens]|uniref:Uncharacterized protein n=1 Tax=Tessaracoccus flavescens TaxID=399497 RepID=A0A921JRI7_9ACTN|nr:hypothetical protein [Tessaracoccus flavescens]
MSEIVSSKFQVTGLNGPYDVKRALQGLYDVFAEQGMGQATFEITEGQEAADLFVKHKADVTPDREVIRKALADAGAFVLLD